MRLWERPTAGGLSASCCLGRARAAGAKRPDSDYDIAVFLRDPDSFWQESGRLAEIEPTSFDTGAVINALPFPAGADGERTPFMYELRRDGLDL